MTRAAFLSLLLAAACGDGSTREVNYPPSDKKGEGAGR